MGVALIVYFIKSYFDGIKSDLKTTGKDVSELRGSFEPLRRDIKENTVALAAIKAELTAVWRYIDAPKRSSDASDANKNGPGYPD